MPCVARRTGTARLALLIDIVCDAGGRDAIGPEAAVALKRRAILRVLDAEQAHLPTCAAMIDALRAALKAG